jgi:hypothetical protein
MAFCPFMGACGSHQPAPTLPVKAGIPHELIKTLNWNPEIPHELINS